MIRGRAERRALIERDDPALPIFLQCRLFAVSRSSVYRRPAEVSEEDRAIMALIDRQYLARPHYGSRRMAAWLATQGHLVNRKRVQRLMRPMGLVAVYQRPDTSKPAPENKVYPYLLGGLTTARVNQVWCADITYIPMARGFSLPGGHHGLGEPRRAGVAAVEHARRGLLRRGPGGGAGTALQARNLQHRPEPALAKAGGCQFTSTDFTGVLERGGITISMDGRGRCMDNILSSDCSEA